MLVNSNTMTSGPNNNCTGLIVTQQRQKVATVRFLTNCSWTGTANIPCVHETAWSAIPVPALRQGSYQCPKCWLLVGRRERRGDRRSWQQVEQCFEGLKRELCNCRNNKLNWQILCTWLVNRMSSRQSKTKNSIKDIGVTVQVYHLKIDILNWKHCCLHLYTYFTGKGINQLKKHSTQGTNWQMMHDTEHKEPIQTYIKDKHSSDRGCYTARPHWAALQLWGHSMKLSTCPR